MPWFVEEMHTTSNDWSPALYLDCPAIGKDMRIKRSEGAGPRVRQAPMMIGAFEAKLGLCLLQRRYGGDDAAS